MSWLMLLMGLAIANEPNAAIEVVASRDIEVFVSPIEVIVATGLENIEAEIDESQAFAYSSVYWRNAQIRNERGAYEPVGLNHGKIKVYSEDTILFAWEDCNYKLRPLKCSVQNGHFYLETTVHVDDNELVVRAVLYDQDAQIIAMGTSTDRKIIKWIKQQEIRQQTVSQPSNGLQQNCQNGMVSCPVPNVSIQGSGTVQTTIDKPKEELPLKWTIPHRLLNRHVQQAMLLMWASTKMDIY